MNKIVPEIKNNLMRSHTSNMVEIEAQKYQDVMRFVFYPSSITLATAGRELSLTMFRVQLNYIRG